VRIVTAGALHGQQGTIIKRAELCEEDEKHDRVTSWPQTRTSTATSSSPWRSDTTCSSTVASSRSSFCRTRWRHGRASASACDSSTRPAAESSGTVESFCTPFDGANRCDGSAQLGLYRVSRPLYAASAASRDLAFVSRTGRLGSSMPDACHLHSPSEVYLQEPQMPWAPGLPQQVQPLPPLSEAELFRAGPERVDTFWYERPSSIREGCRSAVRAAEAACHKHRYWCEVVAMRNPQCKLAALDRERSDALPAHLRLDPADMREKRHELTHGRCCRMHLRTCGRASCTKWAGGVCRCESPPAHLAAACEAAADAVLALRNAAAAELDAARAKLGDVCVKVKHIAKIRHTVFQPIKPNEQLDVVDIPHYRCEHMADAAFADYAMLAYDCSQHPDSADVVAVSKCSLRPHRHRCAWGHYIDIAVDGSSSLSQLQPAGIV